MSRTINVGELHAKNAVLGDHGRAGDTYGNVTDAPSSRHDPARNVFVIHGRDEQARTAVFGFLRALRLHPLEWEQLVSSTRSAAPTPGEVVANAPRQARAVVALLTPDDIVCLHPALGGGTAGCQPRPNVFLELGMALAVQPERTIILRAGQLRETASLAGLDDIRIDHTTRWRNAVAQRLARAGCPVDRSGQDWLDPGLFTGLGAFRRTAEAV